MGTSKRTPIHRSLIMQITPRAVELYRQMCGIRCVCPPRAYGDRYQAPCASCDKWWGLHDQLHRELKLKVWEWPAVLSISGGSRPGADVLEEELRQAAALERRAARAQQDPVAVTDPVGGP
jgi:hypothetical protein